MKEEELTTIQVTKNVVMRLQAFKVHPRQALNEVIEKLLDEKEAENV